MSQRSVERILGRLVADEEFRRRFAAEPGATLAELSAAGFELTPCESRALAGFNARAAERCSRAIDPRLVKADLGGGVPRTIGKTTKVAG